MGHVSSIVNFSSSNAQGQEEAPSEWWDPSSEVIRQILTMRRARAKFFDPDLFAEPAWDILLELYSADLSGVKISVSSTCIGSNVPYTTALRCIRRLKDKGLIRRVNDPHDARRVFLSLTEKGSAGMRAYFQSIAQ